MLRLSPVAARIKRILVGIDFSEPSDQALERAIDLARRLDASLTLLHVYQVPGYAFPETIVPTPPELLTNLLADNRRHLESAVTHCQESRVPADFDQVPGAAFAELVRRAREGYDLVVVGTHGRTGFAHALLGSVAEKVVRKSPVPVLTVRVPKESPAAHSRR
jgi:nucleotide-binding universal stress UspA family protein